MNKNTAKIFISFLLISFFIVGCENNLQMTLPMGPQGEKGEQGEAGLSAFEMWKILYNKDSNTSIEDFFNSLKGEDGADGQDGAVPIIGSNGNWFIDGVDTGIPATGKDGKDGVTPTIGSNGNWFIDGVDTGVPARGKDGSDGKDGITPIIGSNGNWFINGIDTGVPARGNDGADGVSPEVGVNGNWYINGVDTGVPATGPSGAPGVDGKSAYELWKEAVDLGSMTNKDGTPYTGSNTWESFLRWLQGGDVSVLYEFWLSKGNVGDMDAFLTALFDCHCDGISVAIVHPSICVDLDQNGDVLGTYPVTITLAGDVGTSFVLLDGAVTLDNGTIAAGQSDVSFSVLRSATRDITVLINATIPGQADVVTKTALVKQLNYIRFTSSVVPSLISEQDDVVLTFDSSPSEVKIDGSSIYTTAGGISDPTWSVDVTKTVFTKTYDRIASAQNIVVQAGGPNGQCSNSSFVISQLTPVTITTPATLSIIPGNECSLLISLEGTPEMTVTASYKNPNDNTITDVVTLVESPAGSGSYSLNGIPRTYTSYNIAVKAEKAGSGTYTQTLTVNGGYLLDNLAPLTVVNNNTVTSFNISTVSNTFTNTTSSPITVTFKRRTNGTAGAIKSSLGYPFSINIGVGATETVDFIRDYTLNYASGYYDVYYTITDGCGLVTTETKFRINNLTHYRCNFTKPNNWGGAGEPGGPGEAGYPNVTPINPGDPLDVPITVSVELMDAIPNSYFQFQIFTGIGYNTELVGQVDATGSFSGTFTINASSLDKALRNGKANFLFYTDSAYMNKILIGGDKETVDFGF